LAAAPAIASACGGSSYCYSCPPWNTCLYQNYAYNQYNGGAQWNYNIWAESENQYHYVGNSANDQTSSILNNRGALTDVYKDWPVSDYSRIICQGTQAYNLASGWAWWYQVPGSPTGNYTGNMNDEISSYALNSATC
jgi:hypothetical protein